MGKTHQSDTGTDVIIRSILVEIRGHEDLLAICHDSLAEKGIVRNTGNDT
jgi:hypothetical protein